MIIETKYNINDLVQHKFQRNHLGGHAIAFEVIEIGTVCCYTTAQVFYTCRPIHAITKFNFQEKKDSLLDIVSGHADRQEYCKFREDELKPCPDDVKNEILNIKPDTP